MFHITDSLNKVSYAKICSILNQWWFDNFMAGVQMQKEKYNMLYLKNWK